jgi:uncharacterized membrane protein YeaQ/YmgE (transglycosylase-associated protein family)
MSIIGWIVLGTLAGFVANRVLPGRFPGGALGTLVGGMAGAVLGGGLFSLIADRGVAGLDVVSIAIALVGAGILLTLVRWAGHAEPGSR